MNAPRPHWRPAYVGLGSNLDDPAAQIAGALQALAAVRDTRLYLRSPGYRSAPLGPADQPDYVNAAAAVMTMLDPAELLDELQAIENAAGRVRGERWGARTLDLDLLVYGREFIDTPRLSVPHPRIAERNFVLLPLADIAPWLHVPGLGCVQSLAAQASRTEPAIERIRD